MPTQYEKIQKAFAGYSDDQCRKFLSNEIGEELVEYKPNELRAWLWRIMVREGVDTPTHSQTRAQLEHDIIESLLELYGDRDEDEPIEAACNRLDDDVLADFLDDLDTRMHEELVEWG